MLKDLAKHNPSSLNTQILKRHFAVNFSSYNQLLYLFAYRRKKLLLKNLLSSNLLVIWPLELGRLSSQAFKYDNSQRQWGRVKLSGKCPGGIRIHFDIQNDLFFNLLLALSNPTDSILSQGTSHFPKILRQSKPELIIILQLRDSLGQLSGDANKSKLYRYHFPTYKHSLYNFRLHRR